MQGLMEGLCPLGRGLREGLSAWVQDHMRAPTAGTRAHIHTPHPSHTQAWVPTMFLLSAGVTALSGATAAREAAAGREAAAIQASDATLWPQAVLKAFDRAASEPHDVSGVSALLQHLVQTISAYSGLGGGRLSVCDCYPPLLSCNHTGGVQIDAHPHVPYGNLKAHTHPHVCTGGV